MDQKKKIGGCLALGCGGAILLLAIFVGGILVFVASMIKSSDAYQVAMQKAEESPEVAEAIGTPIDAGFFITGNIRTSGPTGEANLSVPLSGPKGDGTLFVVAEKSAGQWTYSTLAFEAPEGGRVDLLESAGGAIPAVSDSPE